MPTDAENYEDRPVVIYRPINYYAGKDAVVIANHFGKSRIIQSWEIGDKVFEDAIHLTSDFFASKSVSFYRPGKSTVYVFHFDRLQIDGLNRNLPAVESDVQTSAQERVTPYFTEQPNYPANPIVLALLGFAISVLTVFYFVIKDRS